VRRLLAAVSLLVALAVLGGAAMLLWAHRGIRAERAPLPLEHGLAAALLAPDRPIRLSYVNSARQVMDRAAVLDSEADPRPDEPYVMSHPAFVLEWADGRILLVDTGMTREGALAFGMPIEKLMGASAIEPLTPVADALGEAAARIGGVLFTHLHIDHVGALPSLCASGAKFTVHMTRAQAERPNYTTKEGLNLVHETPCAEVRVLEGATAAAVPGFPGVAVVAAGGHTPGSQIIAARVQSNSGDRLFVFTGDIVNHVDGIHENIGKPWAYRTFIVPEFEERQTELRRFLAALTKELPPFQLLVSHDLHQLESSGIKPWASR
jgi:glyoxylase-like metal-dependent hydrolase (beta-lactamase superfamily II)